MFKKALVLGANGQDGSYLVQHLLADGWQVVGVGKQETSRWVQPSHNFSYLCLDIIDHELLYEFMTNVSPNYIFHAAAVHGQAGFSYETVWQSVFSVNTQSVLASLEYLRKHPECGFCYISSSKVFGDFDGKTISESSIKYSKCLYSISKNTSYELIDYYRKKHKINALVVWTFNHESPRRNVDYFIPRVARTLVNASRNSSYKETFERLNFWGNWGSASEYMNILVKLSNLEIFDDFVLAAPKTLWAEEFISCLFDSRNMDWRNHVRLKLKAKEKKPIPFSIDLTKISSVSGMLPIKDAYEVTEEIVQSMQTLAVPLSI